MKFVTRLEKDMLLGCMWNRVSCRDRSESRIEVGSDKELMEVRWTAARGVRQENEVGLPKEVF